MRERLLILAPVALVLVLIMIYAAFGSVAQALLIFGSIPMALVGGVMGLILNSLPFIISAGIGFIALFGYSCIKWCRIGKFFQSVKNRRKNWKRFGIVCP